MNGLPPGLAGWVLADQHNQQKSANELNQMQGILGLQGALRQQAIQERMLPLQMKLLEAQALKAGRPENPFAKIDPSKFTQESVKDFIASGGTNPSVLVPVRNLSFQNTGGSIVGLDPVTGEQRTSVGTTLSPHQAWQQNTQFPTQVGIDLARLNQPVLSEAAGGWVQRPPVGLPGVLSAPRLPQGPMPSAMDGATRISPNMMVPPNVQAQRDADAARIQAGEARGGAGMIPTNAVVQGSQPGVIPVPGLGGPKAPPGYEPDPAKPGSLRAIPGGPADIKAGEAGAKADLQARRGLDRANTIIAKVDEALGQTGMFTTGWRGSVLGKLPGTPAYDLSKTLDTIKANLGFEQLEEMRAASPTGGALGSIAVRELEFLQSARAALDKEQSREQLEKNLQQVKTHYTNWKRAVEMSRAGATSPAPGPDAIPSTSRADLFRAADAILAGGR